MRECKLIEVGLMGFLEFVTACMVGSRKSDGDQGFHARRRKKKKLGRWSGVS